LHGPVLVKNPELADQLILKSGFVKEISQTEQSVKTDELAKASRRTAFEN
jgi:CobQ-like glutamine amidotransferase family enzyme